MIEKLRQRIAPIFEESVQEKYTLVKPLPILVWPVKS